MQLFFEKTLKYLQIENILLKEIILRDNLEIKYNESNKNTKLKELNIYNCEFDNLEYECYFNLKLYKTIIDDITINTNPN